MRAKFSFMKTSGIAAVITLLLIISVGGVQASRPAQGTMIATMGMMATMSMGGAGAIPPCPTAEAVMAATMPAMAATMSSTMAATMAGTMNMAISGTMAPTMMVVPGMTMGGCALTANFGTAEVPPGDPKAAGKVSLQLSRPASGPGEVCFNIQVSGIKLPATASHIHKGAAGISGPVVVPFSPPDASGKAMGCTENVDPALVEDILTHPSNYYVNVHNSDFPGGAARAQLGQ